MIDLIQQAAELQGFLAAQGWRFCIIGGVATIRWGEPRLTRDVDVSLFSGFGNGGIEQRSSFLCMLESGCVLQAPQPDNISSNRNVVFQLRMVMLPYIGRDASLLS